MLKPIQWKLLSNEEQSAQLERPIQKQTTAFNASVQLIIDEVKQSGDVALKSFTAQFDNVTLQTLAVTSSEFESAFRQVTPKAVSAMKRVIQQISAFHKPQLPSDFAIETSPGIRCESQARAIRRIGLYVPAGSAPLVSTVLMLGVPSQLAGCPLRILCSPPNRDGMIDPNLLVAAQLCGIDRVFKVGGAQAIAAMAYGTESILKVDKIFGPGNSWVTTAKMLVALDPMGAVYDMPAGPSEVMVIADDAANPKFVAADLLSQAEHGSDSQVILICISDVFAQKVSGELNEQIKYLSRQEIAKQALMNSLSIVADSIEGAIAIANQYAPEHLILQIAEPRAYVSRINEAGSVFLGPWSPESVGDYASGTNHVLPTCGFARNISSLSTRDFMKTFTVQELTQNGLKEIADTVRILADVEGLDAHKRAIDVRLEVNSEENDDE